MDGLLLCGNYTFWVGRKWAGFVLADVEPIHLNSFSTKDQKRQNMETDIRKTNVFFEGGVRKQRSQRRKEKRHSDSTN